MANHTEQLVANLQEVLDVKTGELQKQVESQARLLAQVSAAQKELTDAMGKADWKAATQAQLKMAQKCYF